MTFLNGNQGGNERRVETVSKEVDGVNKGVEDGNREGRGGCTEYKDYMIIQVEDINHGEGIEHVEGSTVRTRHMKIRRWGLGGNRRSQLVRLEEMDQTQDTRTTQKTAMGEVMAVRRMGETSMTRQQC